MSGFRSPGFAHGRDETDREDRSRDGCLGGSAGDRGEVPADRCLVLFPEMLVVFANSAEHEEQRLARRVLMSWLNVGLRRGRSARQREL